VFQMQVFLTIGLSVLFAGERVRPAQMAGAVVALGGLAIIGWTKVTGGLSLGFLLVVGAALGWACGNLIAKRAGRVDFLGFVAWSSLASPIPLALLSLMFEGPTALIEPLLHPTLLAWGSILFLSFGATLFGFGTWARLLSRHDAAVVAPFALLIPVSGMVSTALVFGERLSAMQAIGAMLVILGLALTVFGPRLFRMLQMQSGKLP
jgi:O-acetylserine/cysteine efflux transporter